MTNPTQKAVVLLLATVPLLGGCSHNRLRTLQDAYAIIKSKKFVDLTHAFEPGVPHWPGFPDEQRETLYSYRPGEASMGYGFWAERYSHVGAPTSLASRRARCGHDPHLAYRGASVALDAVSDRCRPPGGRARRCLRRTMDGEWTASHGHGPSRCRLRAAGGGRADQLVQGATFELDSRSRFRKPA
jgi:hypothetical protein